MMIRVPIRKPIAKLARDAHTVRWYFARRETSPLNHLLRSIVATIAVEPEMTLVL